MTHKNPSADTLLPRWACVLLALIAATIGLAASAVTAEFFILGLQRVESDVLARDALVAAGLLMIVTELAAFGLAALLPRERLQALRWRLMACGLLLLAFEAVTIYATQVALARSSESSAGAAGTRIADLRASIDSRRATAAALRTNGLKQSDSIHGWNRAAGADALRQALAAEQQAETLAAELAQLEAGRRTTLTDTLGAQGMLAYSVARAVLISVMGLIMFAAAGSLLRVAPRAPVSAPILQTSTAASTPAGMARPLPRWTTSMPKHSTAYAAVAMPLGAVAAPMATYAPPLPTPPAISAPAAPRKPATVLAQAQPQAQPQAQHTAPAKASTAADRYKHIKAAVLAGRVKPSVRCVQAEACSGTAVARRYLARLAAEGVVVRAGQGWALAQPASTAQLDLLA